MKTRWSLPIAAIALALVAVALWLGANRGATGSADRVADAAAERTARNHAGLLSSELQKFRLLPVVLVEYPDVARVLGGDRAAVPSLNRTLEQLAERTDAAAIYVIDDGGTTLAASNWRLPTSFVGSNYGFRPYFRDAISQGAAELFALGTVSGRPGMFLARRVERGGRTLGVVVVKVEFDAIEAVWAHAAGPTLVVDRNGVILVTSRPDWRFDTTHPLDAATVVWARRSLQFGAAVLRPAPLALAAPMATVGGEPYRAATRPAAIGGARVIYLEPLAPALKAATAGVRFWGLAILCVIALTLTVVVRARERRLLLQETRAALEREVESRTADLQDANARLTIDSHERAAADHRYREAREDLAQANRLGSLGQITAGVAHEINQPVAAIRLHAENASLFHDRGKPEGVHDSLQTIVALTDRIGAITAELRGFAKRRTPEIGPVPIETVIDGTMLLVGDKVRALVQVKMPDRTIQVIGDRIRLEQILVNLIQNAADALKGSSEPQIAIEVIDSDPATIRVSDNGPGLDPSLADDAFTPFATGKANGLGLGLGIARDIAREFGGDIELIPTTTGAAFDVRLWRA